MRSGTLMALVGFSNTGRLSRIFQFQVDVPRKRIDLYRTSTNAYSKLSIGSPAVGRRGLKIQQYG
jgi:hypothetical protein